MTSTISKRLAKLEQTANETTNRFQDMTHEQKQGYFQSMYSDLFETHPFDTQQDYEDDLLNRFYEVLQPGYRPPVIREEMTKAEKLNAQLCEDAWHVAFKRGLTRII